MNQPLRTLAGVIGIGLTWSIVWGAVFGLIGLIILCPLGALCAGVAVAIAQEIGASGIGAIRGSTDRACSLRIPAGDTRVNPMIAV